MSTDPERPVNAGRLVLPVGMVSAVIATGLGCSFYLGSKVTSVDNRLATIESSLSDLARERVAAGERLGRIEAKQADHERRLDRLEHDK
jgi:hypothetical protein